MKTIFNKKTLAMCLATAAFFTLPLTASAQDKLIVKDSTGTAEVFKVDDVGSFQVPGSMIFDNVNQRLGLSTTTPLVALHVSSTSGTNPARGILSAQHNDGAQAAYVQFMKSRGTEAAPVQVNIGDYIGFFDTQVYSGTAYTNTAGFGFVVDNTVTSTDVPTAFTVFTGSKIGAGGRAERMRIRSDGQINFKLLTGAGNAYACIDATGNLYRSATACN